MDMLINLIVVILSQCICVSHQVVHIKYIQILIVNYTSIKLEKNLSKNCPHQKKKKKHELDLVGSGESLRHGSNRSIFHFIHN